MSNKNEMNVQAFFDTLGYLVGKQHNVDVTYTVRKKTDEELAMSEQELKESKRIR